MIDTGPWKVPADVAKAAKEWLDDPNSQPITMTVTINFGPTKPKNPADADYMKGIST